MKKILTLIILILTMATQAFSGETMVINHSLGNIKIGKIPSRVVVFDYGILDTLNKMGVEVVGVPKESLPEYLSQYDDKKYENVGDLKDPNLEKIYELKPDLIIISGRQEPFYKQLSKIAPTLYLKTNSDDYMASLKENVGILGQLFSKEDFMKEEFLKLQEEIADIGRKVREKGSTAVVVLSNNGKLSVYGENSRFGVIHKYFGFKTVDEINADNHGNKITFEYLLEKNPDYLFVVDRSAVKNGKTMSIESLKNSIIETTEAYKNGNIKFLDTEVWYNSIGGLESTEKMIGEIRESLK